jgi:UDP-2-acetamido-3-amino-2,3-dideoxy-glucuronate N-acetyltransferase
MCKYVDVRICGWEDVQVGGYDDWDLLVWVVADRNDEQAVIGSKEIKPDIWGMEAPVFFHSTAVLDEGAQIGAGTKIWHFTHLMPRCVVGERCNIGQNVFIDNEVVIGNGVKIQNNVSVYKGVVIEDDVFLGPSMVFTNVINPRAFVERKTEFKPTIVRKGATIGANATIICGVEIGEYAFIGAGAVITDNIQPFALVYGVPAKRGGWVSKLGYRLTFNDKGEAACPGNGEGYLLKNDHVSLATPFEQ